jgi:hypothetical protein
VSDPFGQPSGISGNAPYVRNGRYRIIDPEGGRPVTWSRVTTFASTLADRYGLEQWGNRMVVHGIGKRLDLYALARTIDKDDSKELNRIAAAAKDAACVDEGANLGTAFHHVAQRIREAGLRLDGLAIPGEYLGIAKTYVDTFARWDITPTVHNELYVAIPELRLVGRFDGLVDCRGYRYIFDDKTAKSLDFSLLEISIQLACYAHAAVMWDHESDQWVDMPVVAQDAALVLHTRTGEGTVDLVPIDIEKGWRHAATARDVREARRTAKQLVLPVDVGLPSRTVDEVVTDAALRARADAATSLEQLSALWRECVAAGTWTDDLASHAIRVADKKFR